MPEGLHLPEVVVEHEFGHQYWYGMVATNEFEDAWMDEGINSYTEVKVLDSILGKNTSIFNHGGHHGGRAGSSSGSATSASPIAIPSHRMPTTITIPILRRNHLRQDRQRAAHARRHHRRRHHGEGDARLLHEVSLHPSGQRRFSEDDRRSFRQRSALVLQSGGLWVAGMDYEVSKSIPFPWTGTKKKKDKKDKKDDKDDTVYQSYVSLHRKEDFVMPVEVEDRFRAMERKFANTGTGKSRWTRFAYQKKAKVVRQKSIPTTRSSSTATTSTTAGWSSPTANRAARSSNYWLFVTQWVSQAMAWWAV